MFRIETGLEIRQTSLIRSLKNTESRNKTRERSSGKYLAFEIQEELTSAQKKLKITDGQPKSRQKSLLPCLHRFMQSLATFKGRKIIQLLCIAVMRMQHGMNAQAYDILVYIGVQLQELSTSQYTLKSLVFRLIFKLWKSLNHASPRSPRSSRSSAYDRRSNIPFLLGNNFQYKHFKDEMKQRLKKSNLIVERQFSDILQEALISDIKLPEQIHPSMRNYKLLIVNMDKKSLSYSYMYPKVLEPFLPINEYRFIISKVNQIIAPEAKCFNMDSTIQLYFLPIFSIFFLLFLMFVAAFLALQEQISEVALTVSLSLIWSLIAVCSLAIYFNNVIYKNLTMIHREVINTLLKLGKQYEGRGMFIQPGQTIEYFHIYLNKDLLMDDDDSCSATSLDSPSFEKDSIRQDEEGSGSERGDIVENHKFRKRISINENLSPEYLHLSPSDSRVSLSHSRNTLLTKLKEQISSGNLAER